MRNIDDICRFYGCDAPQQIEPRVVRLDWRGIAIEARYEPIRWRVIAHLEIESIKPRHAALPMTDTGYRSHYHPIGTIEAEYNGDVIAAVTVWLDEAAESNAWKAREDAARQGDLFA